MERLTLSGHIALSNLPPHRGLIVSLAFFEVASMLADPPYDGDPPSEAITDYIGLYEVVDLDCEVTETVQNIPFVIEHTAGYFFLQIRATLFRVKNSRILAQVPSEERLSQPSRPPSQHRKRKPKKRRNRRYDAKFRYLDNSKGCSKGQPLFVARSAEIWAWP